MSSAVAELDGILQSMLNLKPPGVSGSKISTITTLCTANVQSESVLIQKIYTHFKKTPGTHKLGVLYVVDSVTRQWVDQARKSGQQTGPGAPDGTFAAGVNRVTELLPVLLNDIMGSAPDDQKAKIKKLIEIWERSNTFPAAMLSKVKGDLDKPQSQGSSTTPIGSPAPGFVPLGHQSANSATTAAAPPPQDTSAILEALKNMAKQNATPQSAPAAPVPNNLSNLFGAQPATPPTNSTVNQGHSAANAQAVNPLGALFAGMSNTPSQSATNAPPNLLAGLLPQQQQQAPAFPQNAASASPDVQAQMQLVQLMAAQGIPPDQWGTALQLLNMQNQNANAPANGWPGQNGSSRDDRNASTRSPPGQYRQRSRSPGFDRRRDISPRRRRDSPGYDQYRNDRDGRGDGRRGNEYRQRSPARRRRSPSPPQNDFALPPPGPKLITFDSNMPAKHIKVLSRTLFVGGVTSNDQHLRGLFAQFGLVQTCIVNVDKRHAFIKMINRKDAEAARYGMEEYKDGNTQLRTKWGVGFGPRDCSDYQTGISIIPIERLTEADRKWLLTAEYGGTGGTPVEPGMVVEEPDIEIGAGVSSKAMSRRIPTDMGGKRGPQSSRQGSGSDRDQRKSDRYRDDDRRGGDSNNNNQFGSNGMNGNPSMPFPMNFPTMPNGMPMLPPGFQFPFSQQNNQN